MTCQSTCGDHHCRIEARISASYENIAGLDKAAWCKSVHFFNVNFVNDTLFEPVPCETFDESYISLYLIISRSSSKYGQQMVVTNATSIEQTCHEATRNHFKSISTIEKESQTRFMQIDKFSIFSKFNFYTMLPFSDEEIIIILKSGSDQDVFGAQEIRRWDKV